MGFSPLIINSSCKMATRRQHGQLDPADVSDSEDLEQPEQLKQLEPEDEASVIFFHGKPQIIWRIKSKLC